jgi:acetoin utilization deacetylase AcuC-like enzyme
MKPLGSRSVVRPVTVSSQDRVSILIGRLGSFETALLAPRITEGRPIDLLLNEELTHLHPAPEFHPESQSRLDVLMRAFPERATVEPAGRADLERVHSPAYLDSLFEESDETRWIDFDTFVTPTTPRAAKLAAELAIEAARKGAFAITRPPGHHASRDRAMGFCLINNIAVAARYAQAALGAERVAILDWDIHHGNGTEAIFWEDPTVLYVSLHAWPYYPGTGGPHTKTPAGEDVPGGTSETTINIPLPGGTGDRTYLQAFEQLAYPAVEAFAPDLVLVSIGFDPHRDDPLSPTVLSDKAFYTLASRTASLCPKVGAVLEGGYNLSALPRLVELTIEGFNNPS